MKETDLAKKVIAYLQDAGWNIYQEVQGPGGRADIVAVQNNIIQVIECKLSFSAALLEQAWSWQPFAHYVQCAVPQLRGTKGSRVLQSFAQDKGIGVLAFSYTSVHAVVGAKLNRKALTKRIELHEQQKTFAEAGNAHSNFWSPYRQTCLDWTQFVALHPGCTLKELVKYGHHYKTDSAARSSMIAHIQWGRIKGIRAERNGKTWHLFPVEGKICDGK